MEILSRGSMNSRIQVRLRLFPGEGAKWGNVCLSIIHLSANDIIWAVMTVWKIKGKIIRSVLCVALFISFVHNHKQTHISSSWRCPGFCLFRVLRSSCVFECFSYLAPVCFFLWLAFYVLFVYFWFVLSLAVRTSASDCLEKLYPKWPVTRRENVNSTLSLVKHRAFIPWHKGSKAASLPPTAPAVVFFLFFHQQF